MITNDTEKRKPQMSFIHLIGSFCRVFDMSVVVYVEETVLNQKKYSTYTFESEHVKSVIKKNLEHQNHEKFPYQLFLRLPKNNIDDDLSVAVLIPLGDHKSYKNVLKDIVFHSKSIGKNESTTETKDEEKDSENEDKNLKW